MALFVITCECVRANGVASMCAREPDLSVVCVCVSAVYLNKCACAREKESCGAEKKKKKEKGNPGVPVQSLS